MSHNPAGGGSPFELVATTLLTSSTANTSTWTAANASSWQANDVVVVTAQGRIANSAAWDPDLASLSSPDASLSVTNVFGHRRAGNYGEYQQLFYGVATGSYSGTANWSYNDNSTGQIANRRVYVWVMRGDGSAPSGSSVIGAVTGVSPITLTTGATTGDRIITTACAPKEASAITYTGDGTPTIEVPFYNLENHDGIAYFHDDVPASVEVTTTGSVSIYCGIVISP